eukprot:3060916-Amphidinium_carterae.2
MREVVCTGCSEALTKNFTSTNYRLKQLRQKALCIENKVCCTNIVCRQSLTHARYGQCMRRGTQSFDLRAFRDSKGVCSAASYYDC